jgi:hypothetical protein
LLARAGALIPIPLGAKRRRQRGYNQAAIIARALGRSSGVPVRHALRRVRNTSPQSDLPVEARLDNVRGAFRARRPISGVVAIVDDVVTSTETAREASRGDRRIHPSGDRRIHPSGDRRIHPCVAVSHDPSRHAHLAVSMPQLSFSSRFSVFSH